MFACSPGTRGPQARENDLAAAVKNAPAALLFILLLPGLLVRLLGPVVQGQERVTAHERVTERVTVGLGYPGTGGPVTAQAQTRAMQFSPFYCFCISQLVFECWILMLVSQIRV